MNEQTNEIRIIFNGEVIYTNRAMISIQVSDPNNRVALRALEEARKRCPLIEKHNLQKVASSKNTWSEKESVPVGSSDRNSGYKFTQPRASLEG